MKNKAIILILILFTFTSTISTMAQNRDTEKLLANYDVIIGNYAISIKDKKVGRLEYYGCGRDGYCAECVGYFEIPQLKFDKTTLYIIGKDVFFNEDPYRSFDVQTLKVLDLGMSWKEAFKHKPLYFDKNGIYKGLYATSKMYDLKGYTHLVDHLFTKNNYLYYVDHYYFYQVNNSDKLDYKSLKQLAGNFFQDKNGYYFLDTYVIDNNNAIGKIDFIKIQESTPHPDIHITEDYIVINQKMYPLNDHLKELDLNYKNTQTLDIFNFNGTKAFSDGKNVYYRYMAYYALEKVDCAAEDNKAEFYCIEKDFSKHHLLRETGFTEYYYDIDKGVLYYDTYAASLKLTETSGDVYKINDAYYINDHDRFLDKLNAVKIWNTKTKTYEDLDENYYQHVYGVFYYYKGNLYGHHSELIQKDFDIKNLKILETYSNIYIADSKRIIDFKDSDLLNLETLKVLTMPDGEPTNFLTDGKYLVYDNQLIKNFETTNLWVVNQDLLITKNKIYTKDQVFNRKDLGIPIKILGATKK